MSSTLGMLNSIYLTDQPSVAFKADKTENCGVYRLACFLALFSQHQAPLVGFIIAWGKGPLLLIDCNQVIVGAIIENVDSLFVTSIVTKHQNLNILDYDDADLHFVEGTEGF